MVVGGAFFCGIDDIQGSGGPIERTFEACFREFAQWSVTRAKGSVVEGMVPAGRRIANRADISG